MSKATGAFSSSENQTGQWFPLNKLRVGSLGLLTEGPCGGMNEKPPLGWVFEHEFPGVAQVVEVKEVWPFGGAFIVVFES